MDRSLNSCRKSMAVALQLKHQTLGGRKVILYDPVKAKPDRASVFKVHQLTESEIVWSEVETRIKLAYRFPGTSQIKLKEESGKDVTDSESLIAAIIAYDDAKPERLSAYIQNLVSEVEQNFKKLSEGLTIQKASRTVWELAANKTHAQHIMRTGVLVGLVKACSASSFLASSIAAATVEFILSKTSAPLRKMMINAGAIGGLLKQLTNSKIPRKDDERHRLHAAAAISREFRNSDSKEVLQRLENKSGMTPDQVASILQNACVGLNDKVLSACCAALTYVLPHCTSRRNIIVGTSLIYSNHPDAYKLGLWSLSSAIHASKVELLEILKPKEVILSKGNIINHSPEQLLERIFDLGNSIKDDSNTDDSLIRYISSSLWTFSSAITVAPNTVRDNSLKDVKTAKSMVMGKRGRADLLNDDAELRSLNATVNKGLHMLSSLACNKDIQVAHSACPSCSMWISNPNKRYMRFASKTNCER